MTILDTLITDRVSGTYYNTTDINRVNEAIHYIAALLTSLGYPVTRTLPTNWQMEDEYYIEDADRVTEALVCIKNNFSAIQAGAFPLTFNGLTYDGANKIERFLLNCSILAREMELEWINVQTNTIQSGGRLL